jgi:hypothetical protein
MLLHHQPGPARRVSLYLVILKARPGGMAAPWTFSQTDCGAAAPAVHSTAASVCAMHAFAA